MWGRFHSTQNLMAIGGAFKPWSNENGGKMPPEIAGMTRLELATFGVTGRHSNQLSYIP